MKWITNRIVLIPITVFIIYGWTLSVAPVTKGIVNTFVKKMGSHKSISYHVKLRTKYFNTDDTAVKEANCRLIRSDNDSAFNGYVYYKGCQIIGTNKRVPFEEYYDLHKIYSLDEPLKTITVYNHPATQTWAITSTGAGGVINTYFLDLGKLINYVKDTSIAISSSIEKIDNIDYWKISMSFKSNSQISNIWENLWISTRDTTLRRIANHCTFQGNDQYFEYTLDSIVFDKETPEMLKGLMKAKIDLYKIKEYSPLTAASRKTLNTGVEAPQFSGIDFATGKKVSLSDYKGKTVLLDFWYMGCYYCIQAMPGIEKINDEFNCKGLVVLGINSFDTTATAKTKLPDFIKKNKNTYPTILTDKSTDKLYNVNGYPTIYLINKNGEVAFSQDGYSKNIDSVLEVEIKKIQ